MLPDIDEGYPEEIVENLTEHYKNPINLNTVSMAELSDFIFLSDFQKQSIIYYITKYRPIYSVYELKLVFGISENEASLLYPFFCIKAYNNKIPFDTAITHINQTIIIKSKFTVTENNIWFPNNSQHIGSSDLSKIKYKLKIPQWGSVGITLEKDYGEKYINNNEIYDFQSANIYLTDIWKIKKIIVGDYNISLGQGLIAWNGFSLSKGMNGHIAKLIDVKNMEEVLMSVLR